MTKTGLFLNFVAALLTIRSICVMPFRHFMQLENCFDLIKLCFNVLGLHRIEDRPVVVNGEIVIRPMMYIALSYDHRLIDGREAVTALKIIKEAIEDPTRMLIDL